MKNRPFRAGQARFTKEVGILPPTAATVASSSAAMYAEKL
jgi:hypothetical protein